jgi:ribosome maturation protein SDO1
MRARMRLRITCPTSIVKQAPKSKVAVATEGEGSNAPAEQQGKGTIKDRILGFVEQVESQDATGEEWEVSGFVEPGAFKGLREFVAGETKGRGRIEVLDMAVTHEDEA